VYDNNYPNEIRKITIDTASESWTYGGAGLNAASAGDVWTGSGAGSMDLTAMSSRQGPFKVSLGGTRGLKGSAYTVIVTQKGNSTKPVGLKITSRTGVVDTLDPASIVHATFPIKSFVGNGFGQGAVAYIPMTLGDVNGLKIQALGDKSAGALMVSIMRTGVAGVVVESASNFTLTVKTESLQSTVSIKLPSVFDTASIQISNGPRGADIDLVRGQGAEVNTTFTDDDASTTGSRRIEGQSSRFTVIDFQGKKMFGGDTGTSLKRGQAIVTKYSLDPQTGQVTTKDTQTFGVKLDAKFVNEIVPSTDTSKKIFDTVKTKPNAELLDPFEPLNLPGLALAPTTTTIAPTLAFPTLGSATTTTTIATTTTTIAPTTIAPTTIAPTTTTSSALGNTTVTSDGGPPTITSISPSSGSIAGGTTVTITGTNLTDTTAVTFGGTAGTLITNVSSASVTVVTPANDAGVVDVVVTSSGGTANSTGAFTFRAPPSISATTASSVGMTTATLTGSVNANFASTTVLFEYGTASDLSGSATVSAVESPISGGAASTVSRSLTGGTPGTTYYFRIVASNTNGTTTGPIKSFVAPPTITSISPSGGLPVGGTTVTITGAGFVTGATVTFNGIAATDVTFGSATSITATTPAHAPGVVNVVVTNPNTQFGTLIDGFNYRAPVTVTAIDATKIYGAADPAFTYTTTGLLNGDTLTGSLERASGSGVGTYAIGRGSLANANYTITFVLGHFAIAPAPLSVTAVAKSKIYGATDPALTYTSSGFVNGDTTTVLSGSLTRVAGETVGSYAINQGSVVASGNYTITFTSANLTIAPAPLSVTAVAKSKIYGATDPALTYTSSGFVNGDTATVLSGSLTRVAGETVGSYAIQIGTLTNANYTITFTSANLTITAAPLTITANAATKIYGTVDPLFTYQTSGLVTGDALSGSLTRVAGETVGTYAIQIGTLTNANYTITFTSANLTITPAVCEEKNANKGTDKNCNSIKSAVNSGGLIESNTVLRTQTRITKAFLYRR